VTDVDGVDLAASLERARIAPWRGAAWRFHRARFAAEDSSGSLRVSGRYNRGLDLFQRDETWPALYLGLGRDVCIGEIVRHSTAETLPYLNDYLLSTLELKLSAVLDCRDLAGVGLEERRILQDTDLRPAQALAAAAIAMGSEALLVPSATRLGDNLIVFTATLRPDSNIQVAKSEPARLYVDRSPAAQEKPV
jgi:RES domain-containing protein